MAPASRRRFFCARDTEQNRRRDAGATKPQSTVPPAVQIFCHAKPRPYAWPDFQMTSRGSLAYYLAAWVCGCFFMALAFWLEMQFSRSATLQGTFQSVSFLGFCFFGLIFGAVPSVLFGWILRSLMKLLPRGTIWLWVTLGTALSVVYDLEPGQPRAFAARPAHSPLFRAAHLAIPGRRTPGHAAGQHLGDAPRRCSYRRGPLRGPHPFSGKAGSVTDLNFIAAVVAGANIVNAIVSSGFAGGLMFVGRGFSRDNTRHF